MENNYRLTINEDPQIYLDKDTYQPLRKIDISFSVLFEGQHDGHPWSEQEIYIAECELTDSVMNKLRASITEFVQKVNPFGGHRS